MANDVRLRLTADGSELNAATARAESDLVRLGARAQDAGTRGTAGMTSLADSIIRVGKVGGALALGGFVSTQIGQVIKLADAYAGLNGRLAVVTGSSEKAAKLQGELFKIAQDSRTPLAATSDLYARLAQSTESLALSDERMLAVTRTIGQAMTLSGGSAESMNAAVIQLGQGLASGTLRGEELNSILEQTPALAKAIAEGLGVTVGQLRALGASGSLTAQQIVSALENSRAAVERDFSRLPVTVGQAVTQIGNSLLQTVGVFDQANGLSRGLAGALSTVAQNMDVVVAAAGVVATVVGVRLVQSLAASAAAHLAEAAARNASLAATVRQSEAVAIHTGFVLADARATLASATGLGASVVAQNAVIAASARHTAALATQTAAQGALTAATSLGARAMGLLGGPIGLVTTLLATGAAAWFTWGESAANAQAKASGAAKKTTPEIIAEIKAQTAKLRERNRLLEIDPAAGASSNANAERLAAVLSDIEELRSRSGKAANLDEASRSELLQLNLRHYAELSGELKGLNAEEQRGRELASRPDRSAILQQYATSAQKLQVELARVRAAFGGIIPPGLEAEIRAKFAGPVAAVGKVKLPPIVDSSTRDVLQSYAAGMDALGRITAAASGRLADLSQSQLKLRDIQADPSWAGFSRQQQEQLIASAGFALVAEQEAAAQVALQGAIAASLKARESSIAEIRRGAAAVGDQVQALQDERDAAALVVPGYRSLAEAIQLVAIERLAERQAASLADEGLVLALQAEIDARRRLAAEIRTQDRSKALGDTVKEASEASKQIEQSLTDALFRGFESGKGFARVLRDTVVNAFKTMILRPTVSAVVQPLAGSITSLLGLPGLGGAGGGIGGGLGSLGGVAGLAGTLGSLGSLGSAFGAGIGSTFAGGTLAGGQAAGLLAGGAGAGTGVAGLLGAAAPYAVAALVVAQLLKSKDAKLGFGASGIASGGTVSDAARQFQFGNGDDIGRQGDLQAVAQAVSQAVAAQAKLFGGDSSGLVVQAATDADRKGKVSGTIQIVDATGRQLGGVQTGGTDPLAVAASKLGSAAEVADFFAANTSAAIIAGLQASTLPEKVRGYFAGIDAFALSSEQAQGILAAASATQALQAAFAQTGGSFSAFAALSLQAADKVAQAFGGIDAFSAAAGQYLADFYTAAERSDITTRQLAQTLGGLNLTLPKTRAEYRALVDAQDQNTEAGAAAYAMLVQLAPQFASVTDAGEDLAASMAQVAEAGRQALAQLAGDRADLQAELLRAQGDSAGAALLQRQAELAAITRGLSEADAAAAVAAFDLNTSLREQITLAETAANVARERFDLEGLLLQAQGNTAALRERELAALDASNRGIQEQIFALEDAKAAADEARALRDAWASVGATIADEVKRIQGLGAAPGGASLAQAQAAFATKTAQARAGDQGAAGELAGLSRTLLDLSAQTATSAQELARMRAATAASLQKTLQVLGTAPEADPAVSILPGVLSSPVSAVPLGAVPAPSIKAEAVQAANTTARLEAAVDALRREVEGLRAEARATASHAAKMARLQDDWTLRGLLVRGDNDSPITVRTEPTAPLATTT